MPRTYLNQFDINNQHPLTVPEFLLKAPWEDTSWGNDACPSFLNEARKLKVWVDYDKPEDREHEDGSHYTVSAVSGEGEWVTSLLETDDVIVLMKFLSEDFVAYLVAAGESLVSSLDCAWSEEAEERIRAAIDEINTVLHCMEVHCGDQG